MPWRGVHTSSFNVLRCSVPVIMRLTMHQPHLHQPWWLDRCNAFMHSLSNLHGLEAGLPLPQENIYSPSE